MPSISSKLLSFYTIKRCMISAVLPGSVFYLVGRNLFATAFSQHHYLAGLIVDFLSCRSVVSAEFFPALVGHGLSLGGLL